jgi:acyl-CoA synthetase (AMP-forming)/AMP-acid ligase II
VPKEIILLDALPLRGVGKPDRSAVRTMLVARNR